MGGTIGQNSNVGYFTPTFLTTNKTITDMKKYIFLLLALAFVACEKPGTLDGTVIDYITGDSIKGLKIGLYQFNQFEGLDEAKWSEIDLIATATSNDKGFFVMEVDADLDISSLVFLPILIADTLSANAKYTPYGSHEGGSNITEAINGMFKLKWSSMVQVNLINFPQERIKIHFDGGEVTVKSVFNYSANISNNLVPGQKYKFDLYDLKVVGSETQLEYLGSTSRYIKTQLPEDRDKVDWLMPLQVIEIDYNTLER